MMETAGQIYELSLKTSSDRLRTVICPRTPVFTTDETQQFYEAALQTIRDPWKKQVKKRRRKSGPHVGAELLRLWNHKKRLYDRWNWLPTTRNKENYKEACRRAQQRERQLIKEKN